MKYMVMECHPGYAVVLSDDGRFLKVANMHYDVGQTVADIIEMKEPKPKAAAMRKWIYSAAALAASIMIVIGVMLYMNTMTYASVYITINPEVRIDVNRKDVVVDLNGVNEDGKTLIAGYDHRNKELDLVMDELVDLAIEMGFLHEGGQITLTLDADDGEWVVSHENHLAAHLNEHLTEKMSVTVEIGEWQNHGVTIDIPTGTTAGGYEESDYGETTVPETEIPVTTPAPVTEPAPVTTPAPVTDPPVTAPKPMTTPPIDDDPTDYYDPDDGKTDYDDDPPVTAPKPATSPPVDDDPTDYDDPDDGKTDYDDDDDDNDDDGDDD